MVWVNGKLWVFAKRDKCWIEIGDTWSIDISFVVSGTSIRVRFKEVETKDDLEQYSVLQNLHYRGGGGAGRTVPIIAKSDVWDLPSVLGFIEISSSMIANSARKRFLDFPYRENEKFLWKKWDRTAARYYSNMICRISRFVIHPEIRGLGLAKAFTDAALSYAEAQWHYGGFRPRFMEITADMLRYYKFLGKQFVFVGDTEGNEHRLQKDMRYLVRRARAADTLKGMPQGGGGIMTLQRSYAATLLKYIDSNDRTLGEVINSLKFDPSLLDQDTWEALHKLRRRPKPCYMAGISRSARKYVTMRDSKGRHNPSSAMTTARRIKKSEWQFTSIAIDASAQISQSRDARILQDSFGFVGSTLASKIMRPTDFQLRAGEITLVCGASGSGKSIFLDGIGRILRIRSPNDLQVIGDNSTLVYSGYACSPAIVGSLVELCPRKTPLESARKISLNEFLSVTAQTGLAEPQLFVRQNITLSSGQKYRLRLALSFLERPDILTIDNFCEHLDRFTVAAVCRGIRHLVLAFNVSLVVATAGYDRIDRFLNADQKILMRRGDRAIIVGKNGKF